MAAGEFPREVTGSLWGHRGQCHPRVAAGGLGRCEQMSPAQRHHCSESSRQRAEKEPRVWAVPEHSLQHGWRAGWLNGSSSPRRMRRCPGQTRGGVDVDGATVALGRAP